MLKDVCSVVRLDGPGASTGIIAVSGSNVGGGGKRDEIDD
jgi:hypothetical protein